MANWDEEDDEEEEDEVHAFILAISLTLCSSRLVVTGGERRGGQ